MSDHLNQEILTAGKDREQAAIKARLPELRALQAQSEQSEVVEPVPTSLQPTPTENREPSFYDEASNAVVGGLRDAAQNTLDLGRDATQFMGENLFDMRGQVEGFQLPEVEANKTTGGQIARTLVQFVIPYLGAAKALKAVQITKNAVSTGLVAGAITDGTVFDPQEKRLSNMVLDMTDNDPVFGKAVFDYLKADPSDSNAEGRFKNMLEGGVLGTTLEGLFKAVRMTKAHFTAKGQEPAEAVQAAGAASRKEVAETAEATKESELKEFTNNVRESNGTNGKGNSTKAEVKPKEEPHARAVNEEDVHPQAQNVAPKHTFVDAKKKPIIPKAQVADMVAAAANGDYKAVAENIKNSDFNMDRIDTPEDVKEMINAFSETFKKAHKSATGGKQSHAQTAELAQELGAGKETMKRMFQGTDNLAANVLAHRSLLTASAERVTTLAKLATTGDATAILALRKQVTLHATIQAEMKGVQTEIARALGQYRITAKSVDLAVNERDELLEAMGGHSVNVEFAKKLAAITDAKTLNAVVRRGALARTNSAVLEVYINGLLSGPSTHVVNAMGNGLVALISPAERLGAAAIGKVLRSKDAITGKEMGIRIFGMMEGLLDAVRMSGDGARALLNAGKKTAKGDFKGARAEIDENIDEFGGSIRVALTDEPQLDTAAFKSTELKQQGITAENFDLDPSTLMGKSMDVLGSVVRLSGRALLTSDELFKSVHYRGEMKAQAYRMANLEGLEGDAAFKRMGELIENPTPELRAQAMSAAREGTFTTPVGPIGKSVTELADKTVVGRYLMPFIRTPINLMKYVGTRTPVLNLMSKNVRAEFAAGGARRDLMVSKTAFGGSMYALGGYMAGQGLITGGGEKDQAAERVGGIQQYSIKVGDKYHSFSRMDPFGMFLGISADLSLLAGQIGEEEYTELASIGMLAISRNLISKQYLANAVDFFDSVNSGSERKMTRWINRQASSFIPFSALSNAVRREIDPEIKEVWTVFDAMKAKVPLLSNDVLPAVNVFGEDLYYNKGLGPDIASPIMTSEIKTDVASSEIARLNIDIRKPARTIGTGSGSRGVELNKEQYYRYSKLIGNEAKVDGKGFKDKLIETIESDSYKELPSDPDQTQFVNSKEWIIRSMHRNYKQLALSKLFEEFPELHREWEINEENKGNGLAGKPILPFLQQ